jgi:hypothetical protein
MEQRDLFHDPATWRHAAHDCYSLLVAPWRHYLLTAFTYISWSAIYTDESGKKCSGPAHWAQAMPANLCLVIISTEDSPPWEACSPSARQNLNVLYRFHNSLALPMFWAWWIQATSSYPISVRCILILSSHLSLGFPSGHFHVGSYNKILHTFIILMHATFSAHLILIILTGYLWISTLSSSLRLSPVSSVFSGTLTVRRTYFKKGATRSSKRR